MSETVEQLSAAEAFKTQRLLLWSAVLACSHARQDHLQGLADAMLIAQASGISKEEVRAITGTNDVNVYTNMVQAVEAREEHLVRVREFASAYAPYVGTKIIMSLKEDWDLGDYSPRADGAFYGVEWGPHAGVVITYLDDLGEIQGFAVGEDTVVEATLQG